MTLPINFLRGSWRFINTCSLLATFFAAVAPSAHAQGYLEFSNSQKISIPSGTGSYESPNPRKASVYPSNIAVSGLSGAVWDIKVDLVGFSHTAPGDVVMVLVSPTGKAVTLTQLAGGGSYTNLTNAQITFSSVGGPLPVSSFARQAEYYPGYYTSRGGYRNAGAINMPSPCPSNRFSYTLTDLFSDDPNGTWQLYVVDWWTNDAGSINQGWKLRIAVDQAPQVVTQPSAQTIGEGDGFALTVTAAGSTPLSYQWKKNGIDIPGATAPTYSKAGALAADSGSYACLVSNPFGSATSSSAQVTVNAFPTLSIPQTSYTLDEDTPISGIPVTFGDLETPLSGLVVSATSSNTALFSNASLLVRSGNSVYLNLHPFPHNSGSATIFVKVSDGIAQTTVPVSVTVNSVNDLPVVVLPSTFVMNEDGTAQVTATVADIETTPASLVLSVTSSNTSLIDASGITVTTPSNASQRILTFHPKADAFGSSTLTVSLSDGADVVTMPLVLTVNPVNDPPTMSLASSTINLQKNTSSAPLAISLADVDHSAGALTLTVVSSSPTLFPPSSMVLGGSGYERTLVVTPAADQYGSATLTLSVTDGQYTVTKTVAAAVFSGPAITQQPVGGERLVEQSITLTVAAVGNPSPTFQWRKAGVAINGQTGTTLTLSNLTTGSEATYDVVVTNNVGSVTSDPAVVLVRHPVAITSHPAAQTRATGDSATFSVSVSGTGDITYQWLKDGADIPSATTSTLSLTSLTQQDVGSYSVRVSNGLSTVTSNPASLSVLNVPQMTAQPAGDTKLVGSSLTLSAGVSGSAPLTYQWKKDGVNVSGGTALTLPLTNLAEAQSGSYTLTATNPVGFVTSQPAVLMVLSGIAISSHPQTVVRGIGSDHTFTVAATGGGTLAYEWFKDGSPIPSASASTLSLSNLQSSHAGNYTVRVSNAVSSVLSDPANLEVQTPPSIATAPVSQTVPAETNVSFKVVAEGTAPITYQWKKDGANVSGTQFSGATTNTLTITNVSESDAGDYTCVATNAVGEATSSAAQLQVVPAVGTEWEWVNPLPEGNNFKSQAYLNGTWVVLSDKDTLLRTTDEGATWDAMSETDLGFSAAGTWSQIVAASGKFVLIGGDDSGNARIWTSPDGLVWQVEATNFPAGSKTLWQLAVNGSTMVARDQYGLILRSTDLVNWSTVSGSFTARSEPSSTWSNSYSYQTIDQEIGYMTGSAGVIASLTVSVNLSYSGSQSPLLYLVAPDGTQKLLCNAVSSYYSYGTVNVTFSDAAASTLVGSGYTTSYTGTYKPEEPLSGFASKALIGNWRLRMKMPGNTGSGTLHSVSIQFNASQLAATGLSDLVASGSGFAGVGYYFSSRNYYDWNQNKYSQYLLTTATGDNWTCQLASGLSSYPRGVAFNGSRYVVSAQAKDYSEQDGLFHSTDGTTWTLANPPLTTTPDSASPVFVYNFQLPRFINGQFVAPCSAGGYATFAVSSDGITWNAANNPALPRSILSNTPDQVIYDGGKYRIAGSGPSLASGTTLTSLESKLSGPSGILQDIQALPNGEIWALGYNNLVLKSQDGGTTWVSVSTGQAANTNLTSVIGGLGKTIITGYGLNGFLVSSDGETFTLSNAFQPSWIIFTGTKFAAFTTDGAYTESVDGVNWTTPAPANVGILKPIFYNGKLYGVGSGVSSSSAIWYSLDGVQWAMLADIEYSGPLNSRLAAGNGRIVAVRSGGIFSVDAATGEASNISVTGISSYSNFAVFGYNNFVVISAGKLFTSPDGVAWAERPGAMPANPGLNALTYGPNRFFAAGSGGTILRSESDVLPPPEILRQPEPAHAMEGDALNLSVEIVQPSSGTAYQWFKDGEAIDGATSSVLSIPSLTSSDAGSYYVRITGPGGVSQSEPVSVVVPTQLALQFEPGSAGGPNYYRAAFGNGSFRLFADSSFMASSEDGVNFSYSKFPVKYVGTLSGATFGNGKWVAMQYNRVSIAEGNGPFVEYAPSGASFDGSPRVAYGADRFVAVVPSKIITSADGLFWTLQSSTGGSDIAYDGTQFVCVGANGLIQTSPDGLVWTTRASGVTAHLTRIVKSGSVWVAAGYPASYSSVYQTTVLTSADGITWSRRTMPQNSNVAIGLAGGPAGPVLVANGGVVFTADSTASNWTGVTINDPDFSAADAVQGNGTYLILSQYGIVYSSTTLANGSWTRRLPSLALRSIRDLIYSHGKYYALVVQGTEIRLQESLDGLSWSQKFSFGSSSSNNFYYLAAGSSPGSLVAGGVGSGVRYSTNGGANWTNSALTPTTTSVQEVAFLNGAFYAVSSNRIYRSLDAGATFSVVHYGTSTSSNTNFSDIVFGNGRYIAYGTYNYDGSKLYATSTNGSSFSDVGHPGLINNSLVFGNGAFLGKDSETTLLRSEDGMIWTSVPAPISYGTLSFQNGLFVVCSSDQIAYSANGLTWKIAQLTGTGTTGVKRMVVGGIRAVLYNSSSLLNSPLTTDFLTVTPSFIGNGSVAPSTALIVPRGGSLNFSSSPSYQWRTERWKVDDVLAQSLGDSFVLTNIQSNQSVAAEFEEVPRMPVWTQNLGISSSVAEGASLTLTVGVNSYPLAALQWFKNDEPIPGATSSSLMIFNAQQGDQASYKVVATNSVGSITSNVLSLDVQYAPKLGDLPESLSVNRGDTFELALEVDADPLPVTYQWRRDGVNISGATQATLKFTNFQPHSAGSYSVVVTNARGSFTSDEVVLGYRPGEAGSGKPGSLDPGFRPVSNSGSNSGCENIFPRSGGGYLLVGSFGAGNENAQAAVTALTEDGLPDMTYAPDFEIETGGAVYDSLRQPDGKVLIVGPFVLRRNGVFFTRSLARLNPDGSLDTSFRQQLTIAGVPYTLGLSPNGSIYVGGNFSNVGGYTRANIARFYPTGTLDAGFNTNSGGPNAEVNSILPLSDDAILVGGWFTQYNGNSSRKYLTKLTATGALDATFTQLTYGTGVGATGVNQMALQPDGQVIIAGNWGSLNSSTYGNRFSDLARINANGTLDVGFNPGESTGLVSGNVNQVQLLADGKILVAGDLTGYGSTTPGGNVIRLNSNGSVDTTLTTVNGPNSDVYSALPVADGYIAVGLFETWSGVGRDRVAKINFSGVLDTSFGIATGAIGSTSSVQDIAIQSDGTILVAGSFATFNNINRAYLTKLDATGQTDLSFTPPVLNGSLTRVLSGSGGQSYLAGSFTTVSGNSLTRLARINGSGSVDTSFAVGTGFNSTINALALASDGKLYAGGAFTTYQGTADRARLLRLNPDASVDATFNQGTGFNNTVNDLVVQPDGKILVAGEFGQFNGVTAIGLVRLNVDGSRDSGFAFSSVGSVKQIAITPAGQVYAAGNMTSVNGQPVNGLVRVNSDGSLDSSFAPAADVYLSNFTVDLAVQPDGRLVVANGTAVKRLNLDGSLDVGFFSGPFNSTTLSALRLTSSGKFLVGGSFTTFNGVSRIGLAQLNGDSFPAAPEITVHPRSLSAPLGGAAQLSVTATGYPAPTYQWFLGGNPVPQATNSTLNIQPVGLANAGTYTVTVSNGFGSVTSQPATLSTNSPPSISIIPNQLAALGTAIGPLGFVISDAQTGPENLQVTVTSSNPALISPAGIVLGGTGSSRTLTLLPQPNEVGDSAITILLSDGALTAETTFRVSVASARDTWTNGSFSLAQQQDESISAMTADPDNDGVTNILEYAFGNDPLSPVQENAPGIESTQTGDFVFIYPRPVGVTDVSYDVQSTRNLTSWTSHGSGTYVSTADGIETWQVVLPKGSGSAFFRVNVQAQ